MFVPAAPLDRDNPDKEELRRIGRKVRRRLAANKAARKLAVGEAELWAVPGFLDEIECGRLMAIIDASARPSAVHGAEYSRGLRTSYSADIDPFEPIIRTVQRRIDTLLAIDPVKGERVEGQRYAAGQEFVPHVDWFTAGTTAWERDWPNGGQRTWTAMAYLNRVEEGGETDFPSLGIAIEPRPGTLLVWNNADEEGVPNPFTLHAGNPVIRGTKYVITKWYRCRPWMGT
jgi:prolyl 4-hydroxylase